MISDLSVVKVSDFMKFDLSILDFVPFYNYVISVSESYRPDVVSYKVYGVSDLSGLLMYCNRIYSLFDFTVGKEIKVYDKSFMFILYNRVL